MLSASERAIIISLIRALGKGGGGGGTSDYNDLNNLPKINGVELMGDVTEEELGITGAIAGILVNGVEQAIVNKKVALTVMTNSVDDLINYYKKSETYTQEEVNAMVSMIPKFDIRVVDQLPVSGISLTTVYLLRNAEEEEGSQNLYDEYIYAEYETGLFRWEKLGSQTVDLSDYVTIQSLNSTLQDYVTNSALTEILSNYVTSFDLNITLSGYVEKVAGKGLSTEDFTTEEKQKLESISPSNSTPEMDSRQPSAGVSTTYARGDHTHARDYYKVDVESMADAFDRQKEYKPGDLIWFQTHIWECIEGQGPRQDFIPSCWAQKTVAELINERAAYQDEVIEAIEDDISSIQEGKANKSDLSDVATSGRYNDLSNTPTWVVSGESIVYNLN